jgi:hypothetical protein
MARKGKVPRIRRTKRVRPAAKSRQIAREESIHQSIVRAAKDVKEKEKPEPKHEKPKKEKPKKEKPQKPVRESPFTAVSSPKSVHLETDIDRLYDIIKESGAIHFDDVVKKLGEPEEKVREWTDILEEHKLIDIDYPVVGDPMLKVKKPQNESSAENKEWRKVEEKIKTVDKSHKPKPPKALLALIGVLGGGAAALYLTNLKYAVVDSFMTIINQNQQMSDFINSLPYADAVYQNVAHMAFGAFALVAILVFLSFTLITKRRKKK